MCRAFHYQLNENGTVCVCVCCVGINIIHCGVCMMMICNGLKKNLRNEQQTYQQTRGRTFVIHEHLLLR